MAKVPRVGRNDACSCGSGKKFKHCCEQKQHGMGVSSRLMVVAIIGVVLGAIVLGINSFTSTAGGAPGQVWSSEHGHYHAGSGGGGSAVPTGTPGPGQVWSAEHGHYHNPGQGQ